MCRASVVCSGAAVPAADDRGRPMFFSKPADAIVVGHDDAIPYPPATANLHHEVELVAAIGSRGADIAPERALDHVYGYAVGIDLTRRDLQQVAKDRSWPWGAAKAFDHGAPCGELQPAAAIGHPAKGAIALKVDGEVYCVHDAAELHQRAVAHELDHTPVVLGGFRLDKLFAMGLQLRQGPSLIFAHEAAVANHVGG